MTKPPIFDPKKDVAITDVKKKGDYYTVKGVAEGRHTEIHIPAPSLEVMKSKDAEAYMRRGLLGTKRMEERDAK